MVLKSGICFGHVHIALDDDAFERQFGLKVTLNTVPRGNLRTLDLATPDAVTFQKRVQASKDSDVQEFGVDMLRDLARVAGGTPRNAAFARFVAGKDSLSIVCDVDADTLQAKCTEILAAYSLEDYRKEFAWVDNMRVVVEKDVIKELDQNLFEALNGLRGGNATDLHMTPPEVVSYTEGSELHYNGFGSHGRNFHSLSIEDYVSELDRCNFEGDISDLKQRHRVRSKREGDEEFSDKWSVYGVLHGRSVIHAGWQQPQPHSDARAVLQCHVDQSELLRHHHNLRNGCHFPNLYVSHIDSVLWRASVARCRPQPITA
jgi:uncharacterized protein (TIGR04141 family)